MVEKSVDAKNSKKLMEKFGCFYQALDRWGINLSNAAAPGSRSAQGTFCRTGASAGAKLTIDQIVEMVGAKLPDDIIIATIEKSGSKFDLTSQDLIRLKTSGVSDAVIRAIAK